MNRYKRSLSEQEILLGAIPKRGGRLICDSVACQKFCESRNDPTAKKIVFEMETEYSNRMFIDNLCLSKQKQNNPAEESR